jgi:imidazole glycerol-phosphate synthase subunit HisF
VSNEGILNPLCKRIIPCLDVAEGRTVKGVQFTGLRDVGDPVELAERYQDEGADELVFLDISASHQGRATMVKVVEQVAARLMIPFTVGGGIRTLEDALRLLSAGADKVSVNTAAVLRPQLIADIAETCGAQCCVLAIDAKRFVTLPSDLLLDGDDDKQPHWEVLTHGGRQATGQDALVWAKQAVALGAGEILLTSWDMDGTRSGFDLPLTRCFARGLPVPVIASGGADGPETFVAVFNQGCADAALAASIFHDGHWTVGALKQAIASQLAPSGIRIRV